MVERTFRTFVGGRALNTPMEDDLTEHKGLPVKGYRPQGDDRVAVVNENKALEERVLRQVDNIALNMEVDQRWLAIARTQIEQGFMALNRSIFRPERVDLDE